MRAVSKPVSFGGKDGVTIAPDEWVWTDAVALPFVADPAAPSLAGRKLAVSFHIAGESGSLRRGAWQQSVGDDLSGRTLAVLAAR